MSRSLRPFVLLMLATMVAAGPAAAAFDPAVESQNYSKTNERQTIVDTPQYQQKLDEVSRANFLEMVRIQAADPERNFAGHACATDGRGCAGDVRLDDWGPKGYGLVTPVLFTARDGATLSAHVWATRAGPPQRPGVVITNGSIQASEQMYWQFAQTLAKDGYVVLTFDPQGEARSDEYGEGPDRNEGSPDQTDGRPFFDGTEDAINFFLSTPAHPYVPETSCPTGTSHAPKQDRRVKAGLDAAYNPYWGMLDPSRLGIAGHSYGAAGVAYTATWDPRVKAIVAWDDLGGPGPKDAPVPGTAGGSRTIGETGCPADPAARRTVALHTPAPGMSADYGLPPTPNPP